MMNAIITTAFLLSTSVTEVVSFAASSTNCNGGRTINCRPVRTELSVVSPADLSFLVSDAADAVSTAVDAVASVSSQDAVAEAASSVTQPDGFSPSYSKASYYTTLALYAASFPGLWSQVKRSTKAKIKRKTYVR